MATTVSVEGPLKVPCYQGRVGRTITDKNIRDFWRKHAALSKGRGCYVFGIRTGGGLTPGYVGKATKLFKQETFAHHKITRYQRFLVDYQKGTPVIFFITAAKKKGAPNSAHISQLETFLIHVALALNPELLNIKGTKVEQWAIVGVLRSKGKPSKSAQQFKKLMKIGA